MLFFLFGVASALELPVQSLKSRVRLSSSDAQPIEMGNYFNEFYYLSLKIGSPETEVFALIDTGSKYLWLPSIDCKTCDHADNFYNSSASTSAKSSSKTSTFQYRDASVSGVIVEDKINIAKTEYNVTGFKFLSVSTATGFEDLSADGILGLAFADKALGLKNLVEEFKSQGKIDSASFSLYLNHNWLDQMVDTTPTAVLMLGEYDLRYAKESFKYVKIEERSGFWIAELGNIKADVIRDDVVQDVKTLPGTATKVEFSTGSPLILAPITEYNAMMELITEDYSCYAVENEIYCVCASLNDFPVFTFNIGKKDFELDPVYYVQNSMGVCRILIVESKGETLVLGLPFLRKYYSYFDYDRAEVGLALGVRSYIVVSSGGNYAAMVIFACVGAFVTFRIYGNRKGVKEALL